jgi:pimeloyl-ACP methyl ester carboxylesterase
MTMDTQEAAPDSQEAPLESVRVLAGSRTVSESGAGTLRAGSGTPLVLLHGITGSARMWRRTLPLLAPYHEVIAPTALGHRGGARPALRPTRIEHVVDDAERCLDGLGYQRVHLAGNSMGGWVALELARRKRALSVCALSPAGAWVEHGASRAARKLRNAVSGTRNARWILPLLAQSARFRRWALRDSAAYGERVSRAELVELADDLLGCDVYEDIFGSTEQLLPFTPDCPVTLAWSGADRIFPLHMHGGLARERVQGAHFMVLDGVGHVPMMDDPRLVAETILASTRAAQAREAAYAG